MENSEIRMINQRVLPHKFEIVSLKNYSETADAIKSMIVRGAPAIGATGAFGLALAAKEFSGDKLEDLFVHIDSAYNLLFSTRPTAFDLKYALDIIREEIKSSVSVEEAKKNAVLSAQKYADDSADMCLAIGNIGEQLIEDGSRILTHCNAGALACVDYGTALAPIRVAHRKGKKIFVYTDETRPALQGAKLTAWELANEEIPHAIIVDNAAGLFMLQGEIDLVITGADRVAANGDFANKIGTYEKAVLAKENGIPFYVAAPSSTIDMNTKSWKDIPIEERSPDEVLFNSGINSRGEFDKVLVANKSPVKNPVFDVTPSRYVTAFITEKGIVKPSELRDVF